MQMPAQGREWKEVRAEMVARGGKDVDWRSGRTAVYVFNAGEDIHHVQQDAYTLYMSENGLGPLAFPSLAQMEKDVISMALGLLHGPEGATGAITSGGTDSITMAMKTARDFARATGRQHGGHNIVLPRSAHLAFDKAAHLMDIAVRRVPLKGDGSYEADPAAMAGAVDAATIMLVGSAPSFPHGIIDPIAALGEIAAAKDVWLHVDACVGGYFAPFARMNGVAVPAFDFEVPAVRSMSADLHKYGYCAKGASTVLFRSEDLYRHMPFAMRDWSGAPMTTPTLAGTRPGGAISAAWAVMNVLGVSGYREKQGLVCATRERIEAGVRALGFEVLGKPLLGLMAFRHPEVDSLAVYGAMRAKGWFTSFTAEPQSLHLMLSPKHAEVADAYLADLGAALADVKAGVAAAKVEARYS
ncbi:MAG: aspartate aminotransferase family protein [Hyphomonas sp.]|uniref:pyridoxal phosphate-dependent decarboxylase family protein n=1 Tax=Hyphomonas sp. TaxID=87 RepID=UPI00181BEB68|nr:aminotransferase class V-fold PLP-dependent enzyme [Hyphomonas sp.]MBU3922007.1 aminotransferase class V-fold PLP-dependent enzyme [Alphaproteobacteria bacterium]MBA3069449.1 aspartate aminotransferase family protein [Hyphomonas sp.]MBU4063831.1 aminotransferase class V-fold PLP-dependent enzyme [Alphaproteobacteria bacterium]MBU4164208.1 aminotransferase class V-fold PLP-dependent enzyme [Alphaproteobacteria bacterium]MBU4567715.1 aminotransferase class V-fold PLP-dependent enzyme [Alphapr